MAGVKGRSGGARPGSGGARPGAGRPKKAVVEPVPVGPVGVARPKKTWRVPTAAPDAEVRPPAPTRGGYEPTRDNVRDRKGAVEPEQFLWHRIHEALTRGGALTLAELKACVINHVSQERPAAVAAVVLTELHRRPLVFEATPNGRWTLTSTARTAPEVVRPTHCRGCSGPMPPYRLRRQSAWWREEYCDRSCADAARGGR